MFLSEKKYLPSPFTQIAMVKKLLLGVQLLFGCLFLFGQNSLNSGDFTTGSWGAGQAMVGSAGGSLIITKSVNSSGNKFFRFYGDGSPCGEYQASNNGDAFLSGIAVTAPNNNCGGSNAWLINVPTSSSNVVFKTDGQNDGIDKSIAFVIQGEVREVSTVSQLPIANNVTDENPVTVTANLSGVLATGQGVYLRYTTNAFTASTVVKMSGSGTVYTANIPAQTSGTVVSYYVFSSGDGTVGNPNGPFANGSDADFRTINWNSGSVNGGSNYTYTVKSSANISTATISPTTICAGTTFGVSYIATGIFNPGNVFTAQLSNAAGSFAGPINIGTVTSQTSGTVSVNIPAGTAFGNAYRIRVVSANPSTNGSDNGTDLKILPQITSAYIQSPKAATICPANVFTVYGRAGASTLTNNSGASPEITAQFGYGTSNNPATWTWVTANYNIQAASIENNKAEYNATFPANTFAAGTTYYYGFKFQVGSCGEVLAGQNGIFNNDPGVLTVNSNVSISAHPTITPQSPCLHTSPVELSVTATGTGLSYQWYSNTINSNVGGNPVGGAIGANYYPNTGVAGNLYYYCVVTGTCSAATSNVSGLVTVVANAASVLTSGAQTDNQTVYNDSTPITPITYALTSISGASITGLPAGVSGNFSGNNYTISGIPTTPGVYNYTITFTPVCGTIAPVNGKITVNSYVVEYANIQYPKNPMSFLADGTFDVYAQVQLTGVTDNEALHGTGIEVWIGYSTVNATSASDFASANWTWIPAIYNANYTAALPYYNPVRDEFVVNDFFQKAAAQGNPLVLGSEYFYVSRARRTGSSEFIYGGIDGTNSNTSGGIWNGTSLYANRIKLQDEIVWATENQWKYLDEYSGVFIFDKDPLNAIPNEAILPSILLKTKVEADYLASRPGFETKSLQLNSGVSLTIGSGKTLKVQEGINNLNADSPTKTLTIQSDANLLQVNPAATNHGKIRVERNAVVPFVQYNFWSSPVEGQNLYTLYQSGNAVTPNRVFRYNTATDYYTVISAGNFQKAAGYSIQGELNGQSNSAFFGNINNGNANIALQTTGNRYNLIGNPYPSNIDNDRLYQANLGAISSTFWFWDNTGNTALTQMGSNYNSYATNNFAIYNAAAGVGNSGTGTQNHASKVPNGKIMVGQGFIVQALNVGSPSVAFTNPNRVDAAGIFFAKNQKAEKNVFWLELGSPDGLVNTTAIVYHTDAQNSYDVFDSECGSLASDAIYSLPDNEIRPLAIQGRNFPLPIADSVALGVQFYQPGNYTISLKNPQGIFSGGQKIYLHDKVRHIYSDLSAGNYTFNAQAGSSQNRFEIVYKPGTVMGTENQTKEHLLVYRDGEDFVVKADRGILASAEIYDYSGRLLGQHTGAAVEIRIPATSLNAGAYVLKIIKKDGTHTSKKVVK